MERKHAAEYKAEALRIQAWILRTSQNFLQEQIAKAEARAKVFEMMDQQSTKSEADLMKRKNSTIQSRAQQKEVFVIIYFINNINNTLTVQELSC